MIVESTSTLSTLLTIAATLLGFSLLVQVLQELYKYLTSSKSTAYTKVLKDFLGPLWGRAFESGAAAALQLRGPMQWRQLRPGRVVLPLEKSDLAQLIEQTAPAWVRRALAALRAEVDLQKGRPQEWSAAWPAFLAELTATDKASPGYQTAQDLLAFFRTYGQASAPPVSAEYLLSRLRERFLSHVVQAEERFDHLEKNFDYAYRRRNLRQTFVISLLAAIAFNMPFDQIYQSALKVPPAQAIALAERATSLYKEIQKEIAVSPPAAGAPAPDPLAARLKQLDKILATLGTTSGRPPESASSQTALDYLVTRNQIWNPKDPDRLKKAVGFVFGCFLTAVLASFGAPFWNDATGALLRLASGPAKKPATAEG